MRAIKIDSENRTISEVEISEDDSLRQLQSIVGGYIERAVSLDNNDDVFVDEEGLYNQPQHFFEIEGGHQPFAGNAVIIGSDPKTGKSKPAESSLADIKAKVTFLTLQQFRAKYPQD